MSKHRFQELQPPSYDAAVSSDASPAHGYLRSYRVGSDKLVAPLVTAEQLKAHLALLRAFKNLKTAFDEGKDARIPPLVRSMGPSARWMWFVALSVDRFQKWVPGITKTPIDVWVQYELPPLDVLMVWHTYLLNPFCYAEDTLRLGLLSNLYEVNGYLLKAIMYIGDISNFEPTPERKKSWLEQTGTPFDPLDAAAQMTSRDVECPNCFSHVSVQYIKSAGDGYYQRLFAVSCPSCQFTISRESLAVLKFARDVVLDPDNAADVERCGKAVYLPGTLQTQTTSFAESTGKLVQDTMKQIFSLHEPSVLHNKEDWVRKVLKHTGYAMPKVRAAITQVCMSSGGIYNAQTIFNAYKTNRPFSLGLIGAVIRQGSFIDKMHSLGWTAPGYFDRQEDQLVLIHAVTRYHAFLDLMSSTPGRCVPTLDIDLAWHTHQLMGTTYNYHCGKYVRKYVDHEDKVETILLAFSFDTTCRVWERRFGVPYTYCGCPLPDSTVGQRLSRLTKRLMQFRSSWTPDDLTPPQRADALAATHASEHNMAPMRRGNKVVKELVEFLKKGRIQQLSKWRERDEKSARTRKIDKSLDNKSETHDVSFLYPVPFVVSPPVTRRVAVGPLTGAEDCAVIVAAIAEAATALAETLLSTVPLLLDARGREGQLTVLQIQEAKPL